MNKICFAKQVSNLIAYQGFKLKVNSCFTIYFIYIIDKKYFHPDM